MRQQLLESRSGGNGNGVPINESLRAAGTGEIQAWRPCGRVANSAHDEHGSSIHPAGAHGDEISAERYRLMADKIEADPTLLEIPLANIARWLSQGHSAVKRLEGWRSMIHDAQTSREGMEKLLFILRDEEWESMMWKGFSPFPGVLTKEELARLSWSSRH